MIASKRFAGKGDLPTKLKDSSLALLLTAIKVTDLRVP
jgi:hypothetical protein